MDQGDGQTHEAPDTQDPGHIGESTPVEVAAVESSPTDAPTTEVEPAPVSDKPLRGRKRAPVRVEAAEPDADAQPTPMADALADVALVEPAPRKEYAPIADRVEAVILSTDRALSPERIAIALGLIPEDVQLDAGNAPAKPARGRKRPQSLVEEAISRVDVAVTELNAVYENTGRSFRIEAVAGGYRVMTLSKYAPDLARLRNAKVSSKLSRAAVETLAIIAYKQPMTRAELEAIRGVSCGEVLKSLLERRLVTIKGRAEELGRPMLYGTTREFLDHFGLASIKDLPTVEELRASAGA